jgi:hypothetical protein
VKGLSALATFWAWRDTIKPGAGMAWDIETERLDPASPTRCVGFETKDEGDPLAVAVDDAPLSECRGFHQRATPGQFLIAHNAKYEAQALLTRGVDPGQFAWWDTMLAEWVLVANNTQGLALNLDATAQRYGCTPKDPWVDEMIKAGRVMEVPLDRLMERNRKDVADCRTIYEAQLARMSEAQVRLTIVRSMLMLELARIELEGKQLDAERVAIEVARNAKEIAEHELVLREITGGANPRSVNEMAPVLYGLWPVNVKEEDRGRLVPGCEHPEALTATEEPRKKGCPTCKSTPRRLPVIEPLGFKEPLDRKGKPLRNKPSASWPGGAPSVSVEAMTEVASRARTARQKTWARHHKALVELIAERDKNLLYFQAVCDLAGGVVRADLMQGIAATHRLTCRGKPVPGIDRSCQLQNVPQHLKRLFKPKRPGYLATEVDRTQAEFRDAIFLTRCPQGMADIADPNFDAHIQSGQVLRDGARDVDQYRALFAEYKANPKAVKPLRSMAKPHTFKPLFGGQSGTDAERAYYKWFGEHYHGITEAQEAWDNEVATTGKYVAPTGMVFKWPVGWQAGYGGRMRMINENTGRSLYSIVRNLPIQYFATGEVANVSVLCLIYECRRLGIRHYPVMLVHDSEEGETHADDVEQFHAACGSAYGPLTWAFLHEVWDIDYDLELAAESAHGSHFGEGSDRAHHFLNQGTNEMKFAEGGDKKPRALVSAATHLAVLNQVVDMGVQKSNNPQFKDARKVFLRFEVPEERITYRRDDKDLEGPLVIGAKFTASMNEKATLRKFVEGALGKKFKQGEASQFDVTSLLGKSFLITVTHTTSGENTYANVSGAAPLMKGMKPVKAERPLLVYDLDAPDAGVFEMLAPWLQKAIKECVKPGEPGDVPVNDGEAAPDLGKE